MANEQKLELRDLLGAVSGKPNSAGSSIAVTLKNGIVVDLAKTRLSTLDIERKALIESDGNNPYAQVTLEEAKGMSIFFAAATCKLEEQWQVSISHGRNGGQGDAPLFSALVA